MKMTRKLRVLFVFMTALILITALPIILPMDWAQAADSAGKKFIHGNYAFTGAGGCLVAPGGFADHAQFVPSGAPVGVWDMLASQTWEGFYTFNQDGTGELNSLQRVVDLPGPGLGAPPSMVASQTYWKFTYTVDEGLITFTYVPGTYTNKFLYGPQAGQTLYLTITTPWYGRISPDGKNLSVSFGVPLILQITADQENTIPLPVEVVCNSAQHGFRTGE
jgi:hypothetical protein